MKSLLVLLVSAWVLAANVAAQALPTTKTLRVQVRDSHTDAVIEAAPVLFVEGPSAKSTNANGRVTFRGIALSESEATIWINPDGYAPTFRVVDLDTWETEVVVACVPGDQYSTGVISMLTGGTYSFAGLVHPGSSRAFEVVLDVPPFALPEDAEITFTPYPNWANSQHGIVESDQSLGMLYFSLKDAGGETINAQFSSPIAISIRPWALPDVPGQVSTVASSDLRYYRLDLRQGEFVPEPTIRAVDQVSSQFIYGISRFSMHMAAMDEAALTEWTYSDPGDTPPPAPEPILSLEESTVCDLDCAIAVECGEAGSNCEWGVEKGTTTNFSAELTGALTANFGAKFGNKLVGKVEAEYGFELGGTVGSSYGATTTKSFKGSYTMGESVSGPKRCVSGNAFGYVIYKKFTVKIDGFEVGSFQVPTATDTQRDLDFDSACPGCAETPSYSIKDPNPCNAAPPSGS